MKLEYGWACLVCPEAGTGTSSDRTAEKHTTATGHPTRSYAIPAHAATPDITP